MDFTPIELKAAQKRQAVFGGKVEDYLGQKPQLTLANVVKSMPLKPKADPLVKAEPAVSPENQEILEAAKAALAPASWEREIMDESGCVIGQVPAEVPAVKAQVGTEVCFVPVTALADPRPFVTKDSGKRAEFATGAVRDTNEGKGRFDLVTPIGLKRLAQLYERGAKKYGPRNWEKGIPLWRYLDSAERHLNDFKAGDRAEDHLAAVAWNALCYIHTEELILRGELPQHLAQEKQS